MRCVVCGKGPMDQDPTTVYRMNKKGKAGIWACDEHSTNVDEAVKEIAKTLERIGAGS